MQNKVKCIIIKSILIYNISLLMKILNKILIIPIILGYFFISLTYADDNDKTLTVELLEHGYTIIDSQ